MARLLPSSSGVVQQLCNQFVSQCSCLNALQHLAQSQPTPWAASSSSSSGGGGMPVQQQRHKSTVRMVLLKDHEHLGSRGDIVEVKAGYARHDLFPKGEADYAVPSVIRQLKERGLLSAQALEQLQPGAKKQAARGPDDPSTLPLEQQLPQIIRLLNKQPLVVSRRFSRKQPDQPMIGAVTAQQLCLYAAKQLQVELPRQLLMMTDDNPIVAYGSYKVPLNLRDPASGQQVELAVQVNKTHRAPGLRRLKLWAEQEGLLPRHTQGQQQQQRRPQADVVQPPQQPEAQPQQPSA